jgi:hypothetical protein
MTEHDASAAPRPRRAIVMLQELERGARIRLKNGTIVEVTDNPRDGSWIYARPISPETAEDELVFAEDVVDIVD